MRYRSTPPLIAAGSVLIVVLATTEKHRTRHGTCFLFGIDGYGFQEPRLQMVRGYGFHIIAVGAWMVPENPGLLRSGLRFLVKSAVRLRSGFRFQVKSAVRFRFGLLSKSSFLNCDISHAFTAT